MAAVYHKIGQLQQALEFYQQALHLRHEVSDRAGEATTLTNMAQLYLRMEQPQQALLLYQQALPIRREISDRAGEVATLANIALVLYRHLGRPQEAIAQVEQAITVLVNAGLSQDAAGQTLEDLREILRTMRRGDQLSTMTIDLPSLRAGRLQQIVTNTIAVMTVAHDYRHAWRKAMADELQQAQQGGADSQPQADFFTAILALLDGNSPILPADRPYAHTLAKIQEGIAKGGLPNDDTAQNDDSPFDADLIPRSIAALLGGPQGKMAHAQYLNTISTQAADEGLKAFLQTIQLGLFGGDLSQFGQNLRGVYRKAWGMIIMGVETGSINPGLIEIIVHNTRAVLGSASDKRDEWRSALTQMRNQAMEEDTSELVALLDAVIGLLDAKGNPIGLGTNLTGVYAQIWQAIVERIA